MPIFYIVLLLCYYIIMIVLCYFSIDSFDIATYNSGRVKKRL